MKTALITLAEFVTLAIGIAGAIAWPFVIALATGN